MWTAIKKHPVVAGVLSLFAFVGSAVIFLAALANIWAVYSHETVPDFLAKKGWAMTLPTWQAVVVILAAMGVFVLQTAILREAYRRPYPDVMIFTHKVAEGTAYAFHIRDLFEKAGWRVELGRTDSAQHAVGVAPWRQ